MTRWLIGFTACLALVSAGELAAQDDTTLPMYFKHGSWVCSTAEASRQIYEAAAKQEGEPGRSGRRELDDAL